MSRFLIFFNLGCTIHHYTFEYSDNLKHDYHSYANSAVGIDLLISCEISLGRSVALHSRFTFNLALQRPTDCWAIPAFHLVSLQVSHLWSSLEVTRLGHEMVIYITLRLELPLICIQTTFSVSWVDNKLVMLLHYTACPHHFCFVE